MHSASTDTAADSAEERVATRQIRTDAAEDSARTGSSDGTPCASHDTGAEDKPSKRRGYERNSDGDGDTSDRPEDRLSRVGPLPLRWNRKRRIHDSRPQMANAVEADVSHYRAP